MPIPLCAQFAWKIFTRSTCQYAILTAGKKKHRFVARGAAFINIYAKNGNLSNPRLAPTFPSCKGVWNPHTRACTLSGTFRKYCRLRDQNSFHFAVSNGTIVLLELFHHFYTPRKLGRDGTRKEGMRHIAQVVLRVKWRKKRQNIQVEKMSEEPKGQKSCRH